MDKKTYNSHTKLKINDFYIIAEQEVGCEYLYWEHFQTFDEGCITAPDFADAFSYENGKFFIGEHTDKPKEKRFIDIMLKEDKDIVKAFGEYCRKNNVVTISDLFKEKKFDKKNLLV